MSKLVLIIFVTITLLFLLTGGYQAALAFWLVISIILTLTLTIVGLEKLVRRKAM